MAQSLFIALKEQYLACQIENLPNENLDDD